MFKAVENKDTEFFLNGHNINSFQGILQKGTRDNLITQQLDQKGIQLGSISPFLLRFNWTY